MIEINNIHKEYIVFKKKPTVIIDDVSFSVPTGSVFGIVGGNGAGKTTLLNCIAGTDKDFSGSVKVDGKDIRVIHKVPNVIGYVQDDFIAFPYLTAKEYFEYLGSVAGLSDAVIKSRCDMLFEMFDLSPHVNKRICLFSKGMSQKLVIASVLFGNPKVILMDEPTSNLDVDAKEELKEAFKKIKASGKSVIMSTNSFYDVEHYCDVVGLLSCGKIKSQSVVNDILDDERAGIVLSADDAAYEGLADFVKDMLDIKLFRRTDKITMTSDLRSPNEMLEIVNLSGISYNGLSMFKEGFKEAFLREINAK